jgi:cytochrome c553
MFSKSTLIAAMVFAAGAANADGAAVSSGARLAATCAACHGTAGATKGQTLPPLAGQPKEALSATLHAFKSGGRQSTIMTQIAKGYTDEQIELLAAYFAAQK